MVDPISEGGRALGALASISRGVTTNYEAHFYCRALGAVLSISRDGARGVITNNGTPSYAKDLGALLNISGGVTRNYDAPLLLQGSLIHCLTSAGVGPGV